MLKELFQFYTTPAPAYVKKMGFLEEAIAMEARRKRCLNEWSSHFQNCQNAILKAAEACTHHRKILILGAGSLLDIPLAELSNRFDEVILVDIVFLKTARKRVSAYQNIQLIEEDVTASMENVFLGLPEVENYQAWLENDDIDCVVSLNLISQLPLIPVRWLMQLTQISEAKAGILGQALVQNHLDYLNQFSAIKCLIADRMDVEFNDKGEVIDEVDPLWEVTLPEAQTTWDWTLMPLGEVSRTRGQKNRVGLNIYT